jgi:hypothetical protein
MDLTFTKHQQSTVRKCLMTNDKLLKNDKCKMLNAYEGGVS